MSVIAHHVVITAEGHGHIIVAASDHQQLMQLLNREYKQNSGCQSQLLDLLKELHRASIVAPAEMPRDVVTMDSIVELTDIRTNERKIWTLVYPEFEDSTENMLSVLNPLGTAVLGRRIDDVVCLDVPSGGHRLVRVEEILYQPEHYER